MLRLYKITSSWRPQRRPPARSQISLFGLRSRTKSNYQLRYILSFLPAVELLLGATIPFSRVSNKEAMVGAPAIHRLYLSRYIPLQVAVARVSGGSLTGRFRLVGPGD